MGPTGFDPPGLCRVPQRANVGACRPGGWRQPLDGRGLALAAKTAGRLLPAVRDGRGPATPPNEPTESPAEPLKSGRPVESRGDFSQPGEASSDDRHSTDGYMHVSGCSLSLVSLTEGSS